MARQIWKPGTMLNPVPVVMITSKEGERENVCTVAWTGTICSDPAMTYISLRKERYSYDIIKNSGKFCINLVNEQLAYATDYCGVKSGRDENKFLSMNLEKEKAINFDCPTIKDSPIVLECEVEEIKELGSHDMFIAKIVSVDIDDQYMDENGRFDMQKCNLVTYSHGEYYKLGEKIGKFGYSVKKI
ncbi:MAG: flavin reductase family protein [Clostridia bacterium]|nr:flavin reductase family protein [Clostridia bacterium]